MPTNSTEYMLKYQKERLRRLSIDLRKEEYPPIKAAADLCGMSVSGFVKAAIKEKMERKRLG